MSFRQIIADGIEQKYGHTLANSFSQYCKSEKISDEALYYDLTQMTYKWSVMEVFLIDILLLKNKHAKTIFKYMSKLASEQPDPAPESQPKPKQSTSKQQTKTLESISEKSRTKTEAPVPKTEKKEKEESNEKQSIVDTESKMSTDNIDKESSPILPINEDIENWKVGSVCEVYSKSAKKWLEGTITNIYEDDEGEWLRVQYLGDQAKDVQRYSEFVRLLNKPVSKENEDKSNNEKTGGQDWKNLIFRVSLHSVFDNWKTYDYSKTDEVTLQSIEQRLLISKDGRSKFKVIRVGTFAYFKKDDPKGYQIAVRCDKHQLTEAYEILDQLREKLDAKLKDVKKVEKFKYKPFLDQIVKEIS